MSFKRGPQYKVFITTENPVGSVKATGSTVEATTSDTTVGINNTIKGIGQLGQVTATTSVTHEMKNVSAIDPVWKWEDDPFTVFGQTRPLDNPIRKSWEITITKKGENKTLPLVHDGARFGVTGSSAALFDGLNTMPNDTGYRIYVWDGESFYVGYQGTFAPDGYKEALSPTGVTEQTVVLRGGRWSASIPSGNAALTTTVDITQ